MRCASLDCPFLQQGMLCVHSDFAACEGNGRNEMSNVLGILTTTENREALVERVAFDGYATLALRDSVTC